MKHVEITSLLGEEGTKEEEEEERDCKRGPDKCGVIIATGGFRRIDRALCVVCGGGASVRAEGKLEVRSEAAEAAKQIQCIWHLASYNCKHTLTWHTAAQIAGLSRHRWRGRPPAAPSAQDSLWIDFQCASSSLSKTEARLILPRSPSLLSLPPTPPSSLLSQSQRPSLRRHSLTNSSLSSSHAGSHLLPSPFGPLRPDGVLFFYFYVRKRPAIES